MKLKNVTAFAPGSIGNVGVGFDLLGLAIPVVGDEVKVVKIESGVKIYKIYGVENSLPYEAEKNTAGLALLEMIKGEDLDFGFGVEIKKGIPIGSGLGGSAASAVAAVFAANQLLNKPLTKKELYKYALCGEIAATGEKHGDNIAPSLFGGLTFCPSIPEMPDFVLSINFPESLFCFLIHPHMEIETRKAREVLGQNISLKVHVEQSGLMASFIHGCSTNDIALIKNSLRDVVATPQRKKLIPGYDKINELCKKGEALGVAISGAGPSIFSLFENEEMALNAQKNLKNIKDQLSFKLDSWVTPIDRNGAVIIEEEMK